MFEKILIANRGEIAVRVMRTAKRLGIATVAVYSDADAGALHVRTADEAFPLGGGPASDNYLNVAKIVEAAKRTGAQAVHPGYGFLAENASFAEAITDAGIAFIGPSAGAITTMGEKVAARAVAVEAKVPLAPGSDGPITSADEVIAFGDAHGYPVLVKAAYGGGGRGMREIRSADEAPEAFAAAVREATAAFGNGEVYCERYLVNARHVEVQVFGDSHGEIVYLGDRDCSVQRRHQKLIEEAPAPGLSDELRAAMGEAAVRLAGHVGYVGAGTVEFLVEDGAFFFLEMNTRIQVEHPVTEAVTGLDLVELQLRVADGEPLGMTQADVRITGAAIEARVNAEDASGGLFLPAPGPIATLDAPNDDGLRWDAGYESGDEVLPLYDSLIGKLISAAPTREEAIDQLRDGLARLAVAGVATTAPAARHIIGLAAFRGMEINTLWLESDVDFPEFDEEPEDRFEVEVGGRWYRIPFFPEGVVAAPAGVLAPTEPAASRGAGPRTAGGRSRKKAGDGTVKAPMQGTIVKINVAPGDEVSAGTVLFVLEAMKMENPIQAQQDGVIAAVHAEIGQSTPSGTLLAEFAKADA
ncbi:biotin carboxylase N-terminal domain-containing protein [Microbacterium sp. Bi121]|uniref:acetyl/propionyl/methylcrotonyl-CoA carboxylase subunit alpha n=1 Tax=Microbacterium sp. Bi121 TaxID=2822348 RepID=UPI001D65F7DD|nr:biotin carboxylase N-terminal domain-containing protein [Microbacterium sp. Bi121]CAH0156138.1 Biotin carboxylase [Microbacterium sp. Bi121]